MIFMEIRYQVLAVRMGMKTAATDHDHKINPFDAVNFVGVSVANTTLALHLLIFVLWALFFPFCYPMIARVIVQYLRENWSGLLVVLTPALITALIKKKTLAFTYGPPSRPGFASDRTARNRRCYGCYDVWMLFLSISKGVTAAIVRIVLFLIVGLVSLLSVTQSPLPAWFERYMDTGSKAYRAMILQSIYQNNPVMNVAAWELLEACRQNAAEEPRRLRIPIASAAAAGINGNAQRPASQAAKPGETGSTVAGETTAMRCAQNDDSVEWGAYKTPLELQCWRRNRNRWWLMLMLHYSPLLRTFRATQGTSGDDFWDKDAEATATNGGGDLDLDPTSHHVHETRARTLPGESSVASPDADVGRLSTDELVAEVHSAVLPPVALEGGAARKYQLPSSELHYHQHAQEQEDKMPGQVPAEKDASV
jgi:hypothetical protein